MMSEHVWFVYHGMIGEPELTFSCPGRPARTARYVHVDCAVCGPLTPED